MVGENLCRAELGPAERAAQTARRKEIYEELHPETKHGGDRKSDQVGNLHTRSFAKETALATGKDASTVRRDTARGREIAAPVLALVAGTALDRGGYLDALKKVPKEKQAERVKADLVERRPATEPRPVPTLLDRLLDLWERAAFLVAVEAEA